MRQKLHKILVTGGAGFIGSEFVRQGARSFPLIVVDKVSYAGDTLRIQEVAKDITFYKADITQRARLNKIFSKHKPDVVVHFAAETHVDRSIQDATSFLHTNVIGTQTLMDLSRQYKVKKILHISTDEVYGASTQGRFLETAALKPQNPYAATKAAAEHLIRAAINTYAFPAIIIRPANNYGPWQYPEKFIPVCVLKAIHQKKVPVYGRGEQIREWLHVSDCVRAIVCIMQKGRIGETYNIGSYFEQKNLLTVKAILRYLRKSEELIEFVKDRPGHDFRYSVNCAKLHQLGWRPRILFYKGLSETIQWYINHMDWTEKKRRFLESYWKKVYQKA